MKLDTAVLNTVRFSNKSVIRIDGRETIMFMCWNDEPRLLSGVYFIPRLA
jgi:hypothetical protein